MNTGKMKNMVVLRDIPSNIVEEAIVILKPNIKVKDFNMAQNKKQETSKKQQKDYIINEAQMIVSNYISNIEKKENIKFKTLKKIVNKCKGVNGIFLCLAIVLGISYILRII